MDLLQSNANPFPPTTRSSFTFDGGCGRFGFIFEIVAKVVFEKFGDEVDIAHAHFAQLSRHGFVRQSLNGHVQPRKEGLEILQRRVDGLLQVAGFEEAAAGDVEALKTRFLFQAQLTETILAHGHAMQIREMIDQ